MYFICGFYVDLKSENTVKMSRAHYFVSYFDLIRLDINQYKKALKLYWVKFTGLCKGLMDLDVDKDTYICSHRRSEDIPPAGRLQFLLETCGGNGKGYLDQNNNGIILF